MRLLLGIQQWTRQPENSALWGGLAHTHTHAHTHTQVWGLELLFQNFSVETTSEHSHNVVTLSQIRPDMPRQAMGLCPVGSRNWHPLTSLVTDLPAVRTGTSFYWQGSRDQVTPGGVSKKAAWRTQEGGGALLWPTLERQANLERRTSFVIINDHYLTYLHRILHLKRGFPRWR